MSVQIATNIFVQAIFTLSNKTTIYVLSRVYGSNAIVLHKSTNSGGSWSIVGSSVTCTTIHGSDGSFTMNGAIDTNGVIHVVSLAGFNATRDLAYNTFNTSNDTWGTWEQAQATTNPNGTVYVAIAVDSNNKPHIIYNDVVSSMGNGTFPVKYTNKVGSSWSAATTLSTETYAYSGVNPSIFIRDNNTIEVTYRCCSTAAHGLHYRTYTTSWGSEQTYSSTDSFPDSIRYSNSTLHRYMTVDSGGTWAINGTTTGVGTQYSLPWEHLTQDIQLMIVGDYDNHTWGYRKYTAGAWQDRVVVDTFSSSVYLGSTLKVEYAYRGVYQYDKVNFCWSDLYAVGFFTTFDTPIPLVITPAPAATATSKVNPTVQIQFKGLVSVEHPAVASTSIARGDILKGYLIAPSGAWTVPVARFPYPRVRIGYVQVYTSSGVVVPLNSATITTAAQPVTPSSPVIVSLNVASLSSTAQGISVVPGAISQTFTVASLVASPQSASILVADTTVTLSSLTLSAQPQSLSVGANTFVVLNASELTTSAQGVEMSLGAVSFELQVANLTTQPQSTSLSLGATGVQLNAATLQAQAGNLITFFDVIVLLSAPEISSYALGVTLESIIVLTFNSASINASAQSISIDGGLVYAGVLKRWTGVDWVPEPLKVYVSGSWQSKPLRVYVDGQWKEVDISG